MNYKMMGRFIAQILLIEAAFMLPPFIISAVCRESDAAWGFLCSICITLLVAGLLWLLCRRAKKGFYAKEGLTCTGISWIVMSLLGSLPFVISGVLPNYIDALFEMVAGFTTTGATVIRVAETLPKGFMFWGSFSHWVGGMGVLVFMLAVLPVSEQKGGFTMHLLRAESPGPNVGKLVPRMKQTAMILYVIYVVLTIANFLFLIAGGMPIFEAVCTAFSTAGTGGFCLKNDSMAGYSPYIQTVTTVFMLLFGVNFSCYYLLLMKKVKSVLKNEELRVYLCVIAASIVVIILNLRGVYDTLAETIRHAAFQTVAIVTTTGYATTDFALWPGVSKTVLLCLMIVGGCAGSTAGGFKFSRILLVFKILARNIKQILYPHRVLVVRLNGDVMDEKVLQNTNGYLAAYIIMLVFSLVAVSVDGFSIETNVSAVIACINNIGPGLGAVGPMSNFADYSWFSKLVLIFDMLAGRLEIFPILVLFSGSTWRNK